MRTARLSSPPPSSSGPSSPILYRQLISPIMTSLSPLSPLPSETVLQIIAHLSLPDLASVLRVSSGLWSLVHAHQQGIYHAMAITHGYIGNGDDTEVTLDQLSKRTGPLEGVASWHEVCEYQRPDDARVRVRAHPDRRLLNDRFQQAIANGPSTVTGTRASASQTGGGTCRGTSGGSRWTTSKRPSSPQAEEVSHRIRHRQPWLFMLT